MSPNPNSCISALPLHQIPFVYGPDCMDGLCHTLSLLINFLEVLPLHCGNFQAMSAPESDNLLLELLFFRLKGIAIYEAWPRSVSWRATSRLWMYVCMYLFNTIWQPAKQGCQDLPRSTGRAGLEAILLQLPCQRNQTSSVCGLLALMSHPSPPCASRTWCFQIRSSRGCPWHSNIRA